MRLVWQRAWSQGAGDKGRAAGGPAGMHVHTGSRPAPGMGINSSLDTRHIAYNAIFHHGLYYRFGNFGSLNIFLLFLDEIFVSG